jgi:hypothetical protein
VDEPDPRPAIMAVLRESAEPVREAVLYERVSARLGRAPDPGRFLDALEGMVTVGHLQMAVDHERPPPDPAPFAPRYFRVIG